MDKQTVYLLDDEPALVELHAEVAELAGYIARGYTRASEFFEQVKQFDRNSILVLDLHMPEMDGIEVMRRLAKMQYPPALILVSGHDMAVLYSAEKLCRAHGLEILATLRKPLALSELQELLERHVPDNPDADKHIQSASEIELTIEDLQTAIRDRQLMLYFQPQIDLATRSICGVEALVRWQHPELGMLHPERLILLAEKSGMIGELTRWIIDNAIAQEQQWQQAGLDITVSVNISAADITSLALPEQLVALLEENRLDATNLTLEVTESALMGELVTSLDILTRLRLKGFGLSIDDFGTGYSSLSQLHRVPFTELKIDRSFVSNINNNDEEARAIVKTCIVLGHELNMKVVAEGVESKQDCQLLTELGCDIVQGYYIAKPMPGDELLAWVADFE